jgi:hypothetical protein
MLLGLKATVLILNRGLGDGLYDFHFCFCKLQVLLWYLHVDKCIDCVSTVGAYYSPAGPYKILIADLVFHDCPFI